MAEGKGGQKKEASANQGVLPFDYSRIQFRKCPLQESPFSWERDPISSTAATTTTLAGWLTHTLALFMTKALTKTSSFTEAFLAVLATKALAATVLLLGQDETLMEAPNAAKLVPGHFLEEVHRAVFGLDGVAKGGKKAPLSFVAAKMESAFREKSDGGSEFSSRVRWEIFPRDLKRQLAAEDDRRRLLVLVLLLAGEARRPRALSRQRGAILGRKSAGKRQAEIRTQ